ncbi:MAG: SPOR domain-containing protein [Candidatus Ozemobacteraceae bacterium]
MDPTRRNFDWGPPNGIVPDKGREWAVYVLLFFLMIGGGLLLVDTARSSPADISPSSAPSTSSTSLSSSHELSTPSAPRDHGANSQDTAPSSSNNTAVMANTDGTERPAPASTPAPSRPPSTFLVQLGAYGDEESARATFDQLKKKGFDATLASPSEQFEMFRVFLGPFNTESEAEKLSRRLNELDLPCFVIESP